MRRRRIWLRLHRPCNIDFSYSRSFALSPGLELIFKILVIIHPFMQHSCSRSTCTTSAAFSLQMIARRGNWGDVLQQRQKGEVIWIGMHRHSINSGVNYSGRRRSRICAQSTPDSVDAPPSSLVFFTREAREEDLVAAANLLAEDYLDEGANFFARRIERMNTYLSVKSRFETFRYADRSGALQSMLVACQRASDRGVLRS